MTVTVPLQANWLKADLAALTPNTAWLVAIWHHSPYSKGVFDSDADARASLVSAIYIYCVVQQPL